MPDLLEFSTGDIVRLLSGGPPMTVSLVVSLEASDATGLEAGVHCSWITKAGFPQKAVFLCGQLYKLESKD